MDDLFLFTMTGLGVFLLARGDAINDQKIQIIPAGPTYTANLGTEVILSCAVTGQGDHKYILKWSFNGEVVSRCAGLAVGDLGTLDSDKACNLSISPVAMSSEGIYTCDLFDGEVSQVETSIKFNVVVPTSDLLDVSTGEVVNVSFGQISGCVQPDVGRIFECTVRDTLPGIWSISWILGDTEEEKGFTKETPVRGGYVDLSSRFTIYNTEKDGHAANLTCEASGLGNALLIVTLQLQFCSVSTGVDDVAVAVVTSVTGTLLVVAALMYIARIRRIRRAQEVSTGQTGDAPVHKDVTLQDEGRALQSQFDEGETSQVARKYEDTITPPQISPKYEDTIISHLSHKYEDRITQEVRHKYEDRITPPDDDDLPPWAERWVVTWSDLVIDERVLGCGNFGEVRSGAVKKDGEVARAAIKMLKFTGHASSRQRSDFFDEFRTMSCIGHHPNIVLLIGACQHQDVLYVALEYLPHGDLRSYLRTVRSQSDSDEDALSSDQLVKFALDVAKGMEHLARAGVIHRDLAARNILLGEGLIAKVSDFGLSRGDDIYVQTSQRRVPIRWLAIESVRFQMYTTKSDVWSFGILLWEIASIGGTPYPSIKSESLASKLKRGYRMLKPSNCDDESYALMRECWDEDPNKRPSFTELVSILSDMADQIKHTYMSVDRVNYVNLSAIRPEIDDN